MYAIIFAATYLGVRRYRFWSLRKNLLDIPNERSSHTAPTPRGGGLIIVIASLTAYVVCSKITGRNFSGSYLAGAFLIALISWLDDLLTISFVWRFLIHSAAAILVVSTLGYFTEIELPFLGTFNLKIYGAILTFIWIVWLTNAYNFMDGIDGLAGMQAVTAGIGWIIVGKIAGFQTAALLGGILAFSSLAFLIENWSPAKIFMGDVGSAFLGFSFAVLPLLARNEGAGGAFTASRLPLIAAALIWLFLFDTILTFLRRLLKREKVWQAHREHIYQKLVVFGYTHRFVSILYGAVSVVAIIFFIFALDRKEFFSSGLLLLMTAQSAVLIGFLYFSKTEAA